MKSYFGHSALCLDVGCPEDPSGTGLVPVKQWPKNFPRFGDQRDYKCPNGERFEGRHDKEEEQANCTKVDEKSDFTWIPQSTKDASVWPACVPSKHPFVSSLQRILTSL